MNGKGKKLKAAVIGCGYAGMVDHIPWYSAHPDIELVALVDSNLSQAESCAKRWEGKAYDNISEMLGVENPDVVSVCTPVHLHLQNAMECMNHGCHVLCEKPMAPRLEECQEMIDCAKENGVILGVGLDKRFSEGFRKAREIILSGDIGKVLFTRIHWAANLYDIDHGFRGELHTGGGVFQDCGSHFIDLIRWFFDTEIDTVEGFIDILNPERSQVEDHAVATLGLKNGTRSIIEASWAGTRDYRHSHIEEVWVYGSEGVLKAMGNLRMDLPGIEVFNRKTNEWRLIPTPIDTATFEGYQYKRMLDEFVSAVQEEKDFTPSGEDGAKTIEVVLALYQSWYTNEKVSLPLEQKIPASEIFSSLRESSLKR